MSFFREVTWNSEMKSKGFPKLWMNMEASSSMASSFQIHHYSFNKLTERWYFSDQPSEESLSKPWEWSYNLYVVCKYTSRNWDSSNACLSWLVSSKSKKAKTQVKNLNWNTSRISYLVPVPSTWNIFSRFSNWLKKRLPLLYLVIKNK